MNDSIIINNNMSMQEIAAAVFNDGLKTLVRNTLKNHYGIQEVSYRPLAYGMGIITSGSSNFEFIRSAIVKIAGISMDTIRILEEDSTKNTAFYAYMPEKDKTIQRKLRKQS